MSPNSVASSAILLLLRELEVAIDPSLNTLTRTSWGTDVTGQSPFVDELARALDMVSETVKPLVEGKKYLRNFFDKAVRWVSVLYSCLRLLIEWL